MKTAPYYILPLLDELRGNGPEAERARDLLRINIGDLDLLDRLIRSGSHAATIPDASAAEPARRDTVEQIDAFISRFAPGKTLPPEALQEHTRPDQPEEPAPSEEDSKAVTDVASLIKNRQYCDALEIITQISLINPQKSIYFADQIRFLRKLILNASKI